MKTPHTVVATLLALAVLSGGCASADPSRMSSSQSRYGVAYGVIDKIENVRGGGDGIGAGAIIGGVVGGVLGNQIGGGTGRDVATVAGVVGGAVVGHQIEKRNQEQDTYRIHVRLDHGGYETVMQESVTDLRVGDRIIIENGHVSRY